MGRSIASATSPTLCFQEYPSDPLRKISALHTKVELAGNLSSEQNLAENSAHRQIASWKKNLSTKIACISDAITMKWQKCATRHSDFLTFCLKNGYNIMLVCLILKFIYQQTIVVCSAVIYGVKLDQFPDHLILPFPHVQLYVNR